MQYRLTLRCENMKRDVVIENVNTSFICPACKMQLVYIPTEKRLGAHGKTEKTINHFLKKIEEQTD